MQIGKFQALIIAAVIIAVGCSIYATINPIAPADDNGADATEETGDTGASVPIRTGLSDSISVNNLNWGAIEVVPESYDGKSVTYKAVPKDGCSFVAWFDHDGRYISTANTISSGDLDTEGTTARFVDSPSEPSKTVSYGWQMPLFVFDDKGEMTYKDMTYTARIPNVVLEEYQNRDVHREAVLGNVYLTPWQLVTDDPIVDDIVTYLLPMCEGKTNMQKAWIVMCFVQDVVKYQTDTAQYGRSEYWAFPVETIYSGKGDCEDTAVLFCAVGSKLGLDTGLVSFSYTDSARKNLGHMGAAFALVGTESVKADNTPLFKYKGTTYCYVETATDSRLELGYLLKYPNIAAYLIEDSGFTNILYDDTEGFSHDPLVAIGASYNTSSEVVYNDSVGSDIIYGDDFTNPPIIELTAGDSFSYIPETNLPCKFMATGDGMMSNGGPFQMDLQTYELHGKASKAGTYHVMITAETIEGPYQVAYQYITFKVSEAELPTYSGQIKSLSFVNGSWNMVSAETDTIPVYDNDTTQTEDRHDMAVYVLAACAIVIIAAFVAVRLR